MTCSRAPRAMYAVPLVHGAESRSSRPGWMRFRKSLASPQAVAVVLVIRSAAFAPAIYSAKTQSLKSVGADFLAMPSAAAFARACWGSSSARRVSRSKASITLPERTVAAFHSEFDRPRRIAPRSTRIPFRRSDSSTNSSPCSSVAATSSGHFRKSRQRYATGLSPSPTILPARKVGAPPRLSYPAHAATISRSSLSTTRNPT